MLSLIILYYHIIIDIALVQVGAANTAKQANTSQVVQVKGKL